MPYTKEHKETTRQKILQSAQYLFSTKGFEAVTVNEVMNDCELTRGAFYAHFNSKSELYQESLKFSVENSSLAKIKPKGVSSRAWLRQLLDVYLSIEHVRGEKPCPLAFLVTDITSRNKTIKKSYENAYKNMNKLIANYAGIKSLKKENVVSITSMIIGAVAISRTIDDESLVNSILASCRAQVSVMLEGV